MHLHEKMNRALSEACRRRERVHLTIADQSTRFEGRVDRIYEDRVIRFSSEDVPAAYVLISDVVGIDSEFQISN